MNFLGRLSNKITKIQIVHPKKTKRLKYYIHYKNAK